MSLGGHLIREARLRAGLSQAQLAQRVGTSQPAVARWERGRALPAIERIVEVLRTCGLDLQLRLVPRDDHDVALAVGNLRLDPSDRLRQLVAMDGFAGRARRARAVAAGGASRAAVHEAVHEAGPPVFRPEEILATLAREGVEYVLIGGLAAVVHGSPHFTRDVDICPRRTAENLQRLARALDALDAHLRTGTGDVVVAFPRDAAFLAGVSILKTSTRSGDLDLAFEPAGTRGYPDLHRAAGSIELDGTLVPVAALADVIRSEEAAGRPKDLAVLQTLRALLSRRDDAG